jgi:tRNA threonylcarbamoyladenosine biosynthesis protein TsaE
MSEECSLTITSTSAEETQDLGRRLGPALKAGDVIALEGPLGAGKTCFVQGLAQGLGVAGRVASPTFIVMRCHPGPVTLYHADAYRLSSAEELLDVGLEDWSAQGAVALEWADRVAEALPSDHLTVRLAGSNHERRLTFVAHGPRSQELLEHLQRCAS